MRRRRDTPRTGGGARREREPAADAGPADDGRETERRAEGGCRRAGAPVPAVAGLVSGGLPRGQRGRHARRRAGPVRARPALAGAGRSGQPDRVRGRRAAGRAAAAAGPAGHRRGADRGRTAAAGGGRRAHHGEPVPVQADPADLHRVAAERGGRPGLCRLVDAGRAGRDAALAAGRRGRGLPGPGRAGRHAGARRFRCHGRAHGRLLAGRRRPGDRRVGPGQPAQRGPPAVVAGGDGPRGGGRDPGRMARRGGVVHQVHPDRRQFRFHIGSAVGPPGMAGRRALRRHPGPDADRDRRAATGRAPAGRRGLAAGLS